MFWAWLAFVSLLALAAAAILIDTSFWMVRAWSSAPYWDQWRTVREYRNYTVDGPSLSALLAQHNEHRLVFPRLVFLLDYALFGGANRLLFPLLILIQLAHWAVLCAIGWRRDDRMLFWACAVTSVTLLTSLAQSQNLTWGFQVQFVGVFAAATAGFWLLALAVGREREHRAWRTYLAGSIGLLVVATFTMANGVFCMPLAVCLGLALGASKRFIAGLCLATIVAGVVFFAGFKSAGALTVLAQSPATAFWFVMEYLGSFLAPLYPEHASAAQLGAAPALAGVIGLLLTASAAIRLLLAKDRDPMRLVLLAVMSFVISGAVVTAAGRLGYGLEQALSSRYATPAAVFWSAQLFYWNAVAAESRWRRVAVPAVAGACAVLIVALTVVQARVKSDLINEIAKVGLGRDALRSEVVDLTTFADISENPEDVVELRSFLKKHRLSVFSEPESGLLGKTLPAVLKRAPASACAGAFDRLENVSEGAPEAVKVGGWAWDKQGGREASTIVLTTERDVVVGFGTAHFPRPDVAAAIPWITSVRTGWNGYARAAPNETLKAYAILPSGAFCEIGGRAHDGDRATVLADTTTEALDAPLPAPVSKESTWSLGGAGPVPGPVPEGAYGSWSGADANVGSLTFGPFLPSAGRFGFAIVTGPSPIGQSLSVKDAVSGKVLSKVNLRRRQTWNWVSVDVPQGRPVLVTATDGGGKWGEWMAISPPREGRVGR